MKKVRKYADGGAPKFERSTYERAKAMLRDDPATANELTPALDERIARAKERIAAITQSAPEPAPSRPAVSQNRPAYPTARRVADARGEESDRREQEQQAAAERSFVRDANVSIPPSASRSLGTSPSPSLAPQRPAVDETQMVMDRGGSGPKPSRSLQNVMGVRAQEQMETKGSIYSPDYGLSRAEREEKKAREKLEQEEKKAREKREREAKVREKLGRRRAAIPPVPPPGTRAFANRRRRDLAEPAMMGEPEYKSGGMVGSASKRADGIAQKGKTKGRLY